MTKKTSNQTKTRSKASASSATKDHDDSPNPGPSRAGSGSSEPAASNKKSNEEPHKVRGRNVNSVQVVEKNKALLYKDSDQFILLSQGCSRCAQFERPCLWTISARQTRCHSCGNQSCSLTELEPEKLVERIVGGLSAAMEKLATESDGDPECKESMQAAALAIEGVLEEFEE